MGTQSVWEAELSNLRRVVKKEEDACANERMLRIAAEEELRHVTAGGDAQEHQVRRLTAKILQESAFRAEADERWVCMCVCVCVFGRRLTISLSLSLSLSL
jgi:hypothetical protein